MKNIYISICFLLFFSQCKIKTISNEHTTILQPLEQTLMVSDIAPYIESVDFIALEETSNSLVAFINKILIAPDSSFVILSRGDVFIFNHEGRFVNTIGKRGRGLGEYLNADDICLSDDHKTLMILDMAGVLVYSFPKGDFLNKIPIPPVNFDAICPAKDGGVYLFSANPGEVSDFEDPYYALRHFDKNGIAIEELLPRKDFVFTQGIFTQSYDNSYILRPQEGDNVVYKISNGNISSIYQIDFQDKAIPSRYIFREKDDLGLGMKNYMISSYYKLPIYIHDTPELFYFCAVGKNGSPHNFLYFLDDKQGIHWEDGVSKNIPMNIMASDEKFMYAAFQGLIAGNYQEIPENEKSPLLNYVVPKFKEKNFKENNNPYLVQLKFKKK